MGAEVKNKGGTGRGSKVREGVVRLLAEESYKISLVILHSSTLRSTTGRTVKILGCCCGPAGDHGITLVGIDP